MEFLEALQVLKLADVPVRRVLQEGSSEVVYKVAFMHTSREGIVSMAENLAASDESIGGAD